MKCNKILVALSGGVDSSVCVYLMKQQGYDVTGLVLRLSPAHNSTVAAAQAAADAMGIPLIVAREEEWFQREVVVPWAECYRRGQTPNPCILCNPSTKFALLCREAKNRGFDAIVTGHYAGVEEQEGRYLLKRQSFCPGISRICSTASARISCPCCICRWRECPRIRSEPLLSRQGCPVLRLPGQSGNLLYPGQRLPGLY